MEVVVEMMSALYELLTAYPFFTAAAAGGIVVLLILRWLGLVELELGGKHHFGGFGDGGGGCGDGGGD